MRARKGQAMVEYALVFASLLLVAGVLWALIHAALRHEERTEDLVTSDCP